MTAVSRLVEVLRQDLVLGVQAVGVVPPHPAPLQAQPVGVVAGQQGRPAGGTLGADVGLGQSHSSLGQALADSQGSVGVWGN